MRWTFLAALPLILAACGQGDSGNVMTPNANVLPPELVDLALGPEEPKAPANAVEAANAQIPTDPVEAGERVAPAQTRNRAGTAPADEPADATAEEEFSVETNSTGD